MIKFRFADSIRSARAVTSTSVQKMTKIRFGLGIIVAAIGSVGEVDRRISAFCQLSDASLRDIGVNRQGWRS